MPLSNAERQKRHRERLKAAATGTCMLTPEQKADRDAVMADPLFPVPPEGARGQLPRFMGWERYEWSAAPEPLVDHFGMRSAWEGWRAEMDAMRARQHQLSAAMQVEADRIVAECGEPARHLLQERGRSALIEIYVKDPNFGRKPQKRVT